MRSLPLVLLAACGSSKPAPTPPKPAAPHTVALPGATADGVFLDYLAYDPAHHKVWVPASGTGKVDVIDTTTGQLTPIEGLPTKEFERNGKKRVMGPTSATVGDGVVYVGNRADQSICAFDATSLAKKTCGTLSSSPDGLQYVASTNEVWVTTPRDQSIQVLDAATLAPKTSIKFEGEPEGFAVDNARGLFFTNLEDKDKTVVVDAKAHQIVKTWEPKCGEDGPKGLVFDQHLVVVCPSSVETMDDNGAIITNLPVGDGLDAIDVQNHMVFAAAGRAEKMVIASLDPSGKLAAVATIPTAKGARNAVATEDGTAYVADGPAGAILVVPPVSK